MMAAVGSDRRCSVAFIYQAANYLRRRFGFDGSKPETLEKISRAFHLTRERIRQLKTSAEESETPGTWGAIPRDSESDADGGAASEAGAKRSKQKVDRKEERA